MRGCGRALKALGRSDEMDTPERSKIGGTPLSKFEVISIRCPRREAFVDDFIPFCWVFFDSFFSLDLEGTGRSGVMWGVFNSLDR